MKNLAPDILRQRMLIEGFYEKANVNEQVIRDFFETVSKKLQLNMYQSPFISSPKGKGKEINQGYDCFAPLVDSGISLYVWVNRSFLSCVIYTCAAFDEKVAKEIICQFFEISHAETLSF